MSQSFFRVGASQFACTEFTVVVLHFLARHNSRCVTEKSLTDAKSITLMRLHQTSFAEFATAVLQTEGKSCHHVIDHFHLIHS